MERGWVVAWAPRLHIYMDFILFLKGKQDKKTKNEGVQIKKN
jgi:hypothetical protein